MIKEIILQEVSHNVDNISRAYCEKVLKDSDAIEDILKKRDSASDLDQKALDTFLIKTLGFFENMNILNISMYNIFNEKIFSSKDIKFSNKNDDEKSFYNKISSSVDRFFFGNLDTDLIHKAYITKTKTSYVEFDKIVSYPNYKKAERDIVFSYVPIFIKNDVVAIIQIAIDITDTIKYFSNFESQIFLASTVIFIILLLMIIQNSNYAQQIIEKESNKNIMLEREKSRIQGDNLAKTEFLANISHELRTPLNAIIGFADMILQETHGKLSNLKYLDYVNDIGSAGKHLLGIINDILDYSKAKANKLEVNNIEINLQKIIKSSIRFIKQRADMIGIKLIEKIPKQDIIVNADPKRLRQILLNLLSNSVKFTPPNGFIIIEVIKDDNHVLVKVIDTGIGMTQEDLPRALASFEQIDNRSSRKYEGTGLGLPLTKKLAELISAEFSIESEYKVGTTVTIKFKNTTNNDTKFAGRINE